MEHADSASTAMDPLGALLDGIDRGIEAHLVWNQRLVRCALLRESPGHDMLRPDAHALCRFGVWFSGHRSQLKTFDAALVRGIAEAHRTMHDAVRRLCEAVLRGVPGAAADLQAYEQAQSAMVSGLSALRERIARAATHHDALTGLPLRHGLEYAFAMRAKDARRGQGALWLAMIDIDHFKEVNDSRGHAAGDLALQHVARRLSACMRENDALFRFGGEEFLALLVVREPADVSVLGPRLIDAVRAAPLRTDSRVTLGLTVTAGLARVREGEALASATERADHAMLQGKGQGRDRFVLAPD